MSRRNAVTVVLLAPLFAACGADDALAPRTTTPFVVRRAANATALADVASMTTLPPPAVAVNGTVANDINDLDMIVGWGFTRFAGEAEAVLWNAGAAPIVLPRSGIAFMTQAYAISPDGKTIVGRSGPESVGAQPARWTSFDNAPDVYPAGIDLRGLKRGVGHGVNNSGQIAIEFNDTEFPVNRLYPAIWSGATLTDLIPGETVGRAFAINEAGQVVGTRTGGVFLWQNGSVASLPTAGGTSSTALSINSAGVVAGRTGDRAVLWRNGALETITDVPTNSTAADVNDLGQVVGTQNGRAFFWQAGIGMVDLGPGSAFAINNKGTIVGIANGLVATMWKINFAPVARLTGPDEAKQYESLSFSAATSSDQNGDALTYAWDFGDGATGSGATVTHSYKKQDTYTVTVTVSDPRGLTSTASLDVSVENGKKPKKDHDNNGNGPKSP